MGASRSSIRNVSLLWVLGVAFAAGALFLLRAAKERQALGEENAPPIELAYRRLPVQRAIDPAARRIAMIPAETSVAEVLAERRPGILDQRHEEDELENTRIAPFESTVWRFSARVVEASLHEDGDIYLVVRDRGRELPIELPDPALCKRSPFYEKIATLRSSLMNELRLSAQPRQINRQARMTGLGFFGIRGKGDNGARILPLLDLEWLEPPANESAR